MGKRNMKVLFERVTAQAEESMADKEAVCNGRVTGIGCSKFRGPLAGGDEGDVNLSQSGKQHRGKGQ
jgi:hypothetical protein